MVSSSSLCERCFGTTGVGVQEAHCLCKQVLGDGSVKANDKYMKKNRSWMYTVLGGTALDCSHMHGPPRIMDVSAKVVGMLHLGDFVGGFDNGDKNIQYHKDE